MTSGCGVEIETPLEMFVRRIDEDGRFKIVGTDKEDTVLVLQDSTIEAGELGHRLDVEIEEIEDHVDSMLAVLLDERKEIVCHGITRIVGYYSRVTNWNSSKIGEQRDRIKGRLHGAYGFNGTGVQTEAYNDALSTIDNMSKL